jgi:hypothetical protein
MRVWSSNGFKMWIVYNNPGELSLVATPGFISRSSQDVDSFIMWEERLFLNKNRFSHMYGHLGMLNMVTISNWNPTSFDYFEVHCWVWQVAAHFSSSVSFSCSLHVTFLGKCHADMRQIWPLERGSDFVLWTVRVALFREADTEKKLGFRRNFGYDPIKAMCTVTPRGVNDFIHSFTEQYVRFHEYDILIFNMTIRYWQ